ncbi:L-asparagine permease [Microbacterium trichothecenolyticum]|uniref:L-asparagine permease n=1 Tax=Microbacterium trichothecenolyticum TaxID=69370 RepID=A0ABU0TWT0_MICTR|nr:L-asparagine permease [Microbacterium trichothecenolyticum]
MPGNTARLLDSSCGNRLNGTVNDTPGSHDAAETLHTSTVQLEDSGYHKGLTSRQVQMIAIGGAIGTGLFLGAGGRLAEAGPAIVISYAVCGVFAFIILRALGELVLHRPTSGSFVSYAREFFGEKAAFVSGWFYWINWAMTTIVDITAAAVYMNFFGKYVPWIGAVPQWTWALLALVTVLAVNLVSVKVFGELEFWFALIKVTALVAFLLVGIYFVVFGTPTGAPVGFSLIADNGGFLPNGILPAILLMQGVVFAYASIELIGTAAGETKNPEKVMPRAINSVVLRVAVFYVGSVLLLSLLLPYTAYSKNESPFVTFFASIGVPGVDVIMNMVVLTAALSSLNAGLYSTGRILRSMAIAGSAPQFAARMNKAGVPYGGIAITAVVALFGVVLNLLRARGRVRNRAERRLDRHPRDLGDDHHLPDAPEAAGRSRGAPAALLPPVRGALHGIRHAGVPRRCARARLRRLARHARGDGGRGRRHRDRVVRVPDANRRARRRT